MMRAIFCLALAAIGLSGLTASAASVNAGQDYKIKFFGDRQAPFSGIRFIDEEKTSLSAMKIEDLAWVHLSADPVCSEKQLRAADLSKIVSVRKSLQCRVGAACGSQLILDQMSRESGLSKRFLYTIAYTESEWNHWNENGTVKSSPTDDWGLMQVNGQFRAKTNWSEVVRDPLYNARFATQILLKWSADYVKSIRSYGGVDFYRSVYAVYNGGPDALDRPWKHARMRAADQRFLDVYNSKPWASLSGQCVGQ